MALRLNPAMETYWMVDFGRVGMFLLHRLVMLLLLLPPFIVQSLQVFLSIVLLQHLVFLKLLMALLVKVFQVICGLVKRRTTCCFFV